MLGTSASIFLWMLCMLIRHPSTVDNTHGNLRDHVILVSKVYADTATWSLNIGSHSHARYQLSGLEIGSLPQWIAAQYLTALWILFDGPSWAGFLLVCIFVAVFAARILAWYLWTDVQTVWWLQITAIASWSCNGMDNVAGYNAMQFWIVVKSAVIAQCPDSQDDLIRATRLRLVVYLSYCLCGIGVEKKKSLFKRKKLINKPFTRCINRHKHSCAHPWRARKSLFGSPMRC